MQAMASQTIRTARIAVLAVSLALAPLAAADTVCRPNDLGSVRCPVPPPPPRPLLRADTQAIDRVRQKPAPELKAPVFVPARRTNRLGSTQVDPAEGPVTLCQPDRLGNMRCR